MRTEFIPAACDQAAEALEPALTTLLDLIGDSNQTGAARVSACKVILDYALRLDSYVHGLDCQQESLDKLQAYFDSWGYDAASAGSDEQDDD